LLKPRCTTAAARKVIRDLNEDVRDCVRANLGQHGSSSAVTPGA
jgi:hypothetical protein